jgi:hypothetical protein
MRWRSLQNVLIVCTLGALLSQSAFGQLPGTHLAPGMRSTGVSGVLDCIGGAVTYSGGNTIHTFTTVGNNDFYCPTQRTINYLVVAGGGAGGNAYYAGGGGAGGRLTGTATVNAGTSSVIVGAGGVNVGTANTQGGNGSNSLISTPGGAGSWFTTIVAPTPLASYGSGWGGYELRTRIAVSGFAGTAPISGTQLRVTLSGVSGGNVMNAMYCGHAAAASPSMNYDGNQVQIKVGGNGAITAPVAPSTQVSDAVNFSFSNTKDFICSYNWSSSAQTANTSVSAAFSVGNVGGGGANAGNATTTATATANQYYGPATLFEVFTNVTVIVNATGGGGGGSFNSGNDQGLNGGSGGGGALTTTGKTGGTGIAGQGNNGGASGGSANGGGGGGGAGAVGANGAGSGQTGGNGGPGLASSITGASVFYAGGGGGGAYTGTGGSGGSGGGGKGGDQNVNNCTVGAVNTGGGGGGSEPASTAGCAGGSGIVIVSYPSGAPNVNCAGGTITTVGANTVHTFTTVGSANLTCATGKAINYLIVAGGGWGGTTAGSSTGAGGGAGGVLQGTGTYLAPGATVITVGAGAPVPPAVYTSCTVGTGGSSSIFGIGTATGGGDGACSSQPSSNGGSGSGSSNAAAVGTGLAGQGFAGGNSYSGGIGYGSGGGGGCGGIGGTGTISVGGTGGIGCSSSITGTSICYAGGGAGGLTGTGTAATATCGGGLGGVQGTSATAGTANRGGGGGGQGGAASTAVTGTAGGSGIVVVSYATGTTQTPPPGTWKPLITTQSPPSLGASFNGYHLRTRYNTSAYVAGVANSGNTQIRVTVTGGGTTTNQFNAMWCGHAAAADPSMDFDGSQIQIRFAGAANPSLPSGTLVSDAMNYSFDKTKAFICSYNWNTSSVVYGTTTGPAGINMGSAAGAGANAGVSAAGFNTSNNSYNQVATQIEVFGP